MHHIISPEKLAQTLNIRLLNPFEGEEPTGYDFVLSNEQEKDLDIIENVLMSLSFSTTYPDKIFLSITLPDKGGSTDISFREITNVLYQPERKRVSIESKKNGYVSVISLCRTPLMIDLDLHVNLPEEEYEKHFKTY